MLDCCEPLDVVKVKGITLSKLACLARCNGATATTSYASEITVEDFRKDIMSVSSIGLDRSNRKVLISSYHRGTLAQTGSGRIVYDSISVGWDLIMHACTMVGHFSPLGGYCAAQDMVLIMDVARFKYPPHWVPLTLLFQSMNEIDTETKRSRGYAILSVDDSASTESRSSSCVCLQENDENEQAAAEADTTAGWKELQKIEVKTLIDHSCSLCKS